MSTDEELKEHAEHANNPFDRKVAGSMAVIAAALAVVSVMGHIYTTEELLWQQRASDQWSYYQAKSIRRYESNLAVDVFGALKDAGAIAKYKGNIAKYDQQGKEIEDKAHEMEGESALSGRRALRLHLGEVFLEIAIVMASLAILSKREYLWWAGLASGAVGALTAVSAALLR